MALRCKNRRPIELLFKWIKQHLKIKASWDFTENVVRMHVNSAIILYCLVLNLGYTLKFDRSACATLQAPGISLLDKTPVNELFMNASCPNARVLNCNQLAICLF
jgi:hypothetical protein